MRQYSSIVPALIGLAVSWLTGCVRNPDEGALMKQLEGGKCVTMCDSIVSWKVEEQANCESVSLFDPLTTRNFAERCVASGATALLIRGKISPSALAKLETFLIFGPNDVDSGDGIISIRGSVAVVYARLAGKKGVPVLKQALERMDPVTRGSGSFPPQYVFRSGTSHPMIRKAITLAEK